MKIKCEKCNTLYNIEMPDLDTQFDAQVLVDNGWIYRKLDEDGGDMICHNCSKKEA